MREYLNRRRFLYRVAGYGAAAAGCGWLPAQFAIADPRKLPPAPDHALTVIAGKPRERGRQYGQTFKDQIGTFLDRMVYHSPYFKNPPRDELLRYAGQCVKEVKSYSPLIHDELEGMAEGSGLKFDEVALLAVNEEFYHLGMLPPSGHCTVLAAGSPDTRDGNTYVGQNWDWPDSIYGISSVLLWKRPEGPHLLAYAYPGLWVGAGLNSAGIALCWSSGAQRAGEKLGIPRPRVGIPTYVLIAQMLYQDTLQAAIEEVRRAKQAGWFSFVLADGKGQLARVEGSPKELAVELSQGHLAGVGYGIRQMTRTPKDQPIEQHPQYQRMSKLLEGGKGKLDRGTLQGFLGDHGSDPLSAPCKHYATGGTLDSMLFNATKREAYVNRGPGCLNRWKRFTFEET